jgi:hypothetical protein
MVKIGPSPPEERQSQAISIEKSAVAQALVTVPPELQYINSESKR